MLDEQKIAFRDRVVALGKKYGPEYGLDWRLMAATAILETGWGESKLARRALNLFGIKATDSTPEGEVYLLSENGRTARRFRKFKTEEEAFCAYGRLLSRSRYYERARRMAREMALKVFVANLAPVYCPDDPDYRTKIMQIVEMLGGLGREKDKS